MTQEPKSMHPAGFGYIAVASAITGREIVAAVTSEFAEGLAAVNGRALNQPDAELPLVFLVISGGTEAMICEWVARRSASFGREPVLLLAQPA